MNDERDDMPSDEPDFLESESQLRDVMPAPKGAVGLKKQSKLDPTSGAWIDRAAVVGLATRRADGVITVAARVAQSDLAAASDAHTIRIVDAEANRIGPALDRSADGSAGAIFLLPGIESTLRANGRLRPLADASALELSVGEAYMHCPKAFVRSGLWTAGATTLADLAPERGPTLGPHARSFLERAPFALLGTCDESGAADLSPRGDPAGFLRVVDERTLLIPDRPGNRIADSLRNVLSHPAAGLLVLVPGLDWTLHVTGEARITRDPAWLESSAVKGRAPSLGIRVRVHEAVLEPAPALAHARIWDPSFRLPRKALSAGELLVDQMESGARFRGTKGRVVDWMLERDARKNLY